MPPSAHFGRVTYGHSVAVWHDFRRAVTALIENSGARRIVEVGGGANPLLPIEYVQARGLDYTILDISAAELDKAPAGYNKVVADIGAPAFAAPGAFDFVFSNMLAEHVANAEAFHRNVSAMLRSGGLAFHYFPTLFSLPMVINRLIPERVGQRVLDLLLPGYRSRAGRVGKFPAYYRWCFGPLPMQFRRFGRLGYSVLEYRGAFGYHGYFDRLPRVQRIHEAWVQFLLRHPSPWMTSGAQVLLCKGSPTDPGATSIPSPPGDRDAERGGTA